MSAKRIRQQYRECRFIHLDTVPVGSAIQPHILRPVTICFLGAHQVEERSLRTCNIPGSQEPTGALDQIAGPDQMIATQIVIPFGGSPGDRQTGYHATRKALGLVGLQYRRAYSVKIGWA